MPYIYAADVWCDSCGEKIKAGLESPADPADETSYDSDEYPKAYDAEHEESDTPQHCGAGEQCLEAEELPSGQKIGALLGTRLTTHGVEYLRELLADETDVSGFWRKHADYLGDEDDSD